ncbi:S-adenosyl-L-methionine-dependent methyltransferase [Cantharellus anzutake]|uniref:S-adenosyl-L-methionine-dependent methyltransferase n=1 Tax=Cantharellus anzutake TaxID=1750568 RepID=UPI0019036567|nr:S-adenosyl-L-methionine-dependent methyltransferase [Cantharellus anzutake]KAF8326835.1 S-adenosyl-L-methionine-dependent methyltransferase [Cantharellus anzutake]
MATFSKSSFNSLGYALFRPSYPSLLFETIYKYHASCPEAHWSRAVDLGCGTGQATLELAKKFDHVVGIDSSVGMIQTANENTGGDTLTSSLRIGGRNIEYKAGSAEAFPFIGNDSVDLITAAQAAHWFKYEDFWAETSRSLRKGGSVALWCYSEFRLKGHPSSTPLISAYASDRSQPVGKYFEQPGRGILENHLQAIRFPTSPEWDASSAKRIYFIGNHYPTSTSVPLHGGPKGLISLDNEKDEAREVILNKRVSWDGLTHYLHTWSALHAYWNEHPEDKGRSDGDIVTRFVGSLRDILKQDLGMIPAEVELEWPLALIMLKKAS